MKKKKADNRGFVYSTDPNFKFELSGEEAITPEPKSQVLRVRLETKHRAGKAATIIAGFIGKAEDLEELTKKLKNFCGTGGSAKDGEILIQGDQREKVLQWMKQNGYSNSK